MDVITCLRLCIRLRHTSPVIDYELFTPGHKRTIKGIVIVQISIKRGRSKTTLTLKTCIASVSVYPFMLSKRKHVNFSSLCSLWRTHTNFFLR